MPKGTPKEDRKSRSDEEVSYDQLYKLIKRVRNTYIRKGVTFYKRNETYRGKPVKWEIEL
jgi:hypothetical protein